MTAGARPERTIEPGSSEATSSIDGSDQSCRLSLIVLNFNQRDLVVDCVRSILASASAIDEVIVVDNASSDGSVEALRTSFPDLRIVENAENRYIFGLNDGLAVARGRYVAFCNNDMVVEPDFAEQGLAAFDGPDVAATCARVLDAQGVEQGTRTSGRFEHGLIFYEPLPHVDHPTDCFFAVGGQSIFRKDVLEQLGSIDELLWPMYHEDIELSYRIWKANYRIRYAPGAVCHHLGGATSRKVFTEVELRSFVRQNELLMVWKNISDPRMLAEHVLWFPIRVFMACFRRDRGTLLGTVNAFKRLPRAIRARRVTNRMASITDPTVFTRVSKIAITAQEP